MQIVRAGPMGFKPVGSRLRIDFAVMYSKHTCSILLNGHLLVLQAVPQVLLQLCCWIPLLPVYSLFNHCRSIKLTTCSNNALHWTVRWLCWYREGIYSQYQSPAISFLPLSHRSSSNAGTNYCRGEIFGKRWLHEHKRATSQYTGKGLIQTEPVLDYGLLEQWNWLKHLSLCITLLLITHWVVRSILFSMF